MEGVRLEANLLMKELIDGEATRTDFRWLLNLLAKTLESANGMKRTEESIYIEARTRPRLCGLERDLGQDHDDVWICLDGELR